jgi:hypothetical protein
MPTIGELHDALEPGGSVVIDGWRITRLPALPGPVPRCPDCRRPLDSCTDVWDCVDHTQRRSLDD